MRIARSPADPFPSDPDIQHLPFFAISPVFFKNLFSSYYKRTLYFDMFADIFIRIQHKLFYIVMAFARFNLYALSYGHLFKRAFDTRRTKGGRWAWWLEVIVLVVFWYWYICRNILRCSFKLRLWVSFWSERK